jgi:hypothetical protein
METRIDKNNIEKKLSELIFNPWIRKRTLRNIQVLRLELDEKFTRIDFAYLSGTKYINGGWVQIHDTCFIKPVNSDIKLSLIKAVNIPLAPKKHFFKTTKDCLYYTLYFPPLPINTKAIDIIEMETNDSNYFNFYGVSVERIKKEVINVLN